MGTQTADGYSDEKSIELSIKILKEKFKCTLVGDYNTIYKGPLIGAPWDITGMTNEIPFAVEVKNRETYPHTAFNDVMMEKFKVDEFKKQDFFKKFGLFNIYNDGYLAIGNALEEPIECGYQNMPNSTHFEDKSKKPKLMVHFTRKKLIKLDEKEKEVGGFKVRITK